MFKYVRNIGKFLFSRLVVTALLIVFQLFFAYEVINHLSGVYAYIDSGLRLLSLLLVIHLVNEDYRVPDGKLPWIIIIMLFPLVGGIAYLLFGNVFSELPNIILRYRYAEEYKKHVEGDGDLDQLIVENEKLGSQALYISKYSLGKVYGNTYSEYLSIGEKMFEKLLEMLEKAEHYIFMEYFIVEEGYMMNQIKEVLKRKAKEGVDVRFMYDDIGCINILPRKFRKEMSEAGIKVAVFNPFNVIVNVVHNNRDHRKITVVDGYMGITGGINLADEYINHKVRFGHWKDNAIYTEGKAVEDLTYMFLENWHYCTKEMPNFDDYRAELYMPREYKEQGYVQSYGDSPLDYELLGESVYINILNGATKYCYITTPYLIIDYTFLNAIELAAKRGVDVRIITPYIPDKRVIQMLTRSYYAPLLDAGVRIFEYKPGFIHAKTWCCDDEVGVVGTINLDYRSLVHHYECGTILYKSDSIKDIKQDLDETLEKCIEIHKDTYKHYILYNIILEVAKLFAALL